MSVDYNSREWVQSKFCPLHRKCCKKPQKKPTQKSVLEILMAFISWKLPRYSKIGFPNLCGPPAADKHYCRFSVPPDEHVCS